jgi:two-component system response regulator FixJ
MGVSGSKLAYVVDDDPAVCEALAFLLETMSVDCRFFSTAKDFISEADRLDPGCVLLDEQLPDRSGLDVQAELRRRGIQLPVIMMSTDGSPAGLLAAMRRGFVRYLEKPFDESDLDAALQAGFEQLAGRDNEIAKRAWAEGTVAALSATQKLVLRGMIAGMSNERIASLLYLTPLQVLRIRARLMDRLGLERRADMLSLACFADLTPLDPLEGGLPV